MTTGSTNAIVTGIPDWQDSLNLISEFLDASVILLERKEEDNRWLFFRNAPSLSIDLEKNDIKEIVSKYISDYYNNLANKPLLYISGRENNPYYIECITLNIVPVRRLSLWLITKNISGFKNRERTLINQSVQILEQKLSSPGFFSGKGIQVSGGYSEEFERYQLIFDNSPIGIIFYNTNLIITLANERFCSIMKSSVSQVIGADINFFPDSRIIPALTDAINGKEGYYEGDYQSSIKHKLNSVLLKTAPVYNRQHEITGGIGIIQDITENINAKKAQEESEMRFKQVAIHTNDVIYEWNSKEGLFQWHGNIRSIIGNDTKPSTYNNLIKIIHPDDSERLKKAWKIKKGGFVLWKEQFRVILSGGEVKHLRGSGITGFSDDGHFKALGTLTDITHEIELIESLKEALHTAESNHAKAQGLLSANPDPYFVIDKHGFFRDYHTEKNHILYISPERLINKSVDDILPAGIAALTREKITKVLSNKSMETYTFTIVFNNTPHIFESRMVPYVKDMVISITRDITKSKEIEKELVESKERAIESDRLKSSFLANMSHEIRTPLNGIMGFAELLQNEDVLPENRDFYLGLILKSGEQLLGVINDVLDISKIETGQLSLYKTEVNIKELILSLFSIFEVRAKEKSIHLYTSIPKSIKPQILKTDLQKLTQILNNLLGNAVKFSRVNGDIRFGYKEINKTICFFVEDNGIGIDPKDQEIIFERFRQAESDKNTDKSGSGLGLSICKSLVGFMGGKIWVESTPGKGSTFYFTLPRGK